MASIINIIITIGTKRYSLKVGNLYIDFAIKIKAINTHTTAEIVLKGIVKWTSSQLAPENISLGFHNKLCLEIHRIEDIFRNTIEKIYLNNLFCEELKKGIDNSEKRLYKIEYLVIANPIEKNRFNKKIKLNKVRAGYLTNEKLISLFKTGSINDESGAANARAHIDQDFKHEIEVINIPKSWILNRFDFCLNRNNNGRLNREYFKKYSLKSFLIIPPIDSIKSGLETEW